MPRASRRQSQAIRPNAKIWFELDGDYVFGHGLARMLKAVDDAGSIKEAAQQLGKSYRYVWGRIKAAESGLGQTLVETHVGGKGLQRSNLTAEARSLVENFLTLRQKVLDTLAREFAEVSKRKA